MDLKNLINVQYKVCLNQNKLQQVLKTLDNRISQVNINYIQLDKKFNTLQKLESKQTKFQNFSIDNFKSIANEFKQLKDLLKKQLGKKFAKEQEENQLNKLNYSLSTQISQFQKENKNIKQKVIQLKTQIVKTSTHLDQKDQQVKQIIKKQRQQINQQIEKAVDRRISTLQKQIQTKNQQYLTKKISKIDENIQKLTQQNQVVRASLLSSEFNRSQLSQKRLGSSNSLYKLNKRGTITEKQDKLQNSQMNISFKNLSNKGISENKFKIRQSITNLNFQAQSFQHLIQSLKNQINQRIKSQNLQFQTTLATISQKNNKFQQLISNLKNQQSNIGCNIQIFNDKMIDIKNHIQNLKTSIYELNQKNRTVANKCTQNQDKTTEIVFNLDQIKKQFNQRILACQENQNKKFKQIQNYNPNELKNSRNHSFKNAVVNSGGPHLDDSFVVHKINGLTQRINKIEDSLKSNGFTSQSSLPRINSSTNIGIKGSNIPSFDILKKDLQKTNEQLLNTNDRILTLKKNLKELEAAHNAIPKKIQSLQLKMTQINQLQQDRLLDLIKQLINRVLTDPFNNNFTNNLKKEIHIKFLQIKHQYASIWKQIQSKVSDRVQIKQLQILKQNVQHKDLQLKAMVNKKTDIQDFKKGIKYLQGKGEQQKSRTKKEYYMGKK